MFGAIGKLLSPSSLEEDERSDRWVGDYRMDDLPRIQEWRRSDDLFKPREGLRTNWHDGSPYGYRNTTSRNWRFPSRSLAIVPQQQQQQQPSGQTRGSNRTSNSTSNSENLEDPPSKFPKFIKRIAEAIEEDWTTYRDFILISMVIYMIVLHKVIWDLESLRARQSREHADHSRMLAEHLERELEDREDAYDALERTRESIRQLVQLIGRYYVHLAPTGGGDVDAAPFIDEITSLYGLGLTERDAQVLINTFRASQVVLATASTGTALPEGWVPGRRVQDGLVVHSEDELLATIQTLALELRSAEERVADMKEYAAMYGLDLSDLMGRRSNAQSYRNPDPATHAQLAKMWQEERMEEINNMLLHRVAAVSRQSEQDLVRNVRREAQREARRVPQEAGPSSSSPPLEAARRPRGWWRARQ